MSMYMVVVRNILSFFFSDQTDRIMSLIFVESVEVSFSISFQDLDLVAEEKYIKILIEFNSVINDVAVLFLIPMRF